MSLFEIQSLTQLFHQLFLTSLVKPQIDLLSAQFQRFCRVPVLVSLSLSLHLKKKKYFSLIPLSRRECKRKKKGKILLDLPSRDQFVVDEQWQAFHMCQVGVSISWAAHGCYLRGVQCSAELDCSFVQGKGSESSSEGQHLLKLQGTAGACVLCPSY